MKKESIQVELTRLQKEQGKTRRDEVFGGLSPEERSTYNFKQARIRDLEHDLGASAPNRPQDLDSPWNIHPHHGLQKSN